MWNLSLLPRSPKPHQTNASQHRFLLVMSAGLLLLVFMILLCPRTMATRTRPDAAEQMATARSIYQSNIVVIDLASKERYTLVEDEGYCQSPAWSPDGSQLLFARFIDDTSDIWSVDVDHRKTTKVYGVPEVDEVCPVVSPDGGTLAHIISHNHGQKLELALLNLRTQSLLSEDQPMTLGGVDWISDTDLLFTAPTKEPSRAADIQVVDTSDVSQRSEASISSPARLLMSDYAVHRPSQQVCARGSFLGFGDIYWWKSMSAEPEQLTHDPSEDRDPAWSPDGKRIVFASDRTGDFDLYILDIETGDVENVTQDTESDDLEPAWSPDGTKIAFRRVTPRNPKDIKGVVPAADEVSVDRSPGILRVGKYLDHVTVTFHPWKPMSIAYRKFVEGSAMLGARGELLGPRPKYSLSSAGLAIVPAQDGIELYCSGWRQEMRYGTMTGTGRISVDEQFLLGATN
ncbi:MAG: PD40 domain-containing protein, partial [Candidatus Hydrogenedentes bacterium]|nr:PD40 domain-containing protein [Candidatus Hydrogenedentota bacterium]